MKPVTEIFKMVLTEMMILTGPINFPFKKCKALSRKKEKLKFYLFIIS